MDIAPCLPNTAIVASKGIQGPGWHVNKCWSISMTLRLTRISTQTWASPDPFITASSASEDDHCLYTHRRTSATTSVVKSGGRHQIQTAPPPFKHLWGWPLFTHAQEDLCNNVCGQIRGQASDSDCPAPLQAPLRMTIVSTRTGGPLRQRLWSNHGAGIRFRLPRPPSSTSKDDHCLHTHRRTSRTAVAKSGGRTIQSTVKPLYGWPLFIHSQEDFYGHLWSNQGAQIWFRLPSRLATSLCYLALSLILPKFISLLVWFWINPQGGHTWAVICNTV